MSRTTVFRCGLLIDGTGATPSKDQLVVVDDDRITKVGSRDEVHVGGEAVEIDASDCVMIPGLIDCHVHLASESTGKKMNPEMWELKTPYVLKVAHAANNARKTLEGGFTTIRNMGHQWTGDPPWDASLRDAIAQGLLPGPRILASVNMIGMTSSHGDIFLPPHYPMRPIRVADGADDCRLAVRENVRAGADFIKITASGGGVLGWGDRPEWRNFSLDEMRAIVDEAHSFGKKVAAHAVGIQGIRNAIECGVDTIEHGYQLDEEAIVRMKEKDVTLVPTLTAVHSMLSFGKDLGIPDEQIENVKSLESGYVRSLKFARKIGLRMASGTDIAGTWSLHGLNARELTLRVELLGASPLEAIQAATSVSGKTLGLTDIGTIGPGKRADFLLVRGNPMEDVRILEEKSKIAMIVKEGRIVSGRRNDS